MQGRYERRKPKKKTSAGKIVLIVLAVIVLIVAVAAGGAYLYFRAMLEKVNYVQMPPKTEPAVLETEKAPLPQETTAATQEPTTQPTTVETTVPEMKPEDIINVLVVGQSGRPGEDALLADTMLLLSMNTYTNTLTVTSILRDTCVELPDYMGHDCGESKMTFCYNLGYQWGGTAGAMDMTNICLRNNFGIEVDYNVEVDFDGFIKTIDYLGGVKLDINQAEADYLNKDTLFVKRTIEPGYIRLNGMEALSYARMRKAEGDADSDIKRTARQRNLLNALLQKLKRRNLVGLQEMANLVLPFITTNILSRCPVQN